MTLRYVKNHPLETNITMRKAYGDALSDEAKNNDRIYIVDSDISSPPRSWFVANAPERVIETGLTEANAIGIAAGLASEGKIPYWFNMGFLLTTVYSQMRQSVAEDMRNVKIICYACGVSGVGGRSHNYVEDFALMRSIPNFMVLSPADITELKKMVKASVMYHGPVYIRFPREPPLPIIFEEDYPFSMGKGTWVKEGRDGTIIATGSMVGESLIAANHMKSEGADIGVLNISSLKPLDREAIAAAAESSFIVTAEDHSVIGGLGDAVASVVSEENPVKVIKMGVNDQFCSSGQLDCRKYYGLESANIVEILRLAVKRYHK